MTLSILYGLVLVLLRLSVQVRHPTLSPTPLRAALDQGPFPTTTPLSNALAEPLARDFNCLNNLIKTALFRARQVDRALSELHLHLGLAERHAAEAIRLQQLLIFRVFLLSGVGLGGRLCLLQILAPAGYSFWSGSGCFGFIDGMLVVLALMVSIAYAEGLIHLYPKDWFWRAGFSPEARVWLEARFLGEAQAGSSLVLPWRMLRWSELQTGRDEEEGRLRELGLWLGQRQDEGVQAIRRFHDSLPLWDLFGLGLPVFLLLAYPAFLLTTNGLAIQAQIT